MYKLFAAVLLVQQALAMPGLFNLPRRIVGGEQATPHEFPFQITLLFNGQHICGGSIYNADTIITAAHCGEISSNPASFSISAGRHNIRIPELTAQNRRVVSVVLHPEWPGDTGLSNDIAIMKLDSPLNFTVNAVGPILLEDDPNPTGVVTVSGWGDTLEGGSSPANLRKVDVPIVSDDECRESYGQSEIEDSMICAGVPAGGRDACQGDSGGPMFRKNANGNFTLVGVVSWGLGCARPGYPGVYTEVSYFADFVRANA